MNKISKSTIRKANAQARHQNLTWIGADIAYENQTTTNGLWIWKYDKKENRYFPLTSFYSDDVENFIKILGMEV